MASQYGIPPIFICFVKSERADDVAGSRPSQAHNLALIVVDVVLRTLDAGLVVFHLEIDLSVHSGVEIVVGDDLLWLGVEHLLGNVNQVYPLNGRDNPVKSGLGKFGVFSHCFNQFIIMWFFFPDTLGLPLEEVAAIFGDHEEVAGYMRDIHITDDEVENVDGFGSGLENEKGKPFAQGTENVA